MAIIDSERGFDRDSLMIARYNAAPNELIKLDHPMNPPQRRV